jgi:hypothetical protein
MYSPDCSARHLLRIVAILFLLSFVAAGECPAGQVQLAWNASADATVSGYKVYHGTQSGTYTDTVDANNTLTQGFSGISESQTHYFAVTAYSADAESDFSEELVCYGISVAPTTNGKILPAGSLLLAAGGSQTVSIVPDSGFVIRDVVIDGNSIGAATAYTFANLDRNHTISAVFAQTTPANSNYTITASVQGSGAITPSGALSIASGKSQTYKITPAKKMKIADVIVDGASVGTQSTYTFSNVSADHTITAVFAGTYKIKAKIKGKGTLSPSGTAIVASGQNMTYTITPSAGYLIADVSVDGASVGSVSSYTFSNLAANHSIKATFTPITYTISASVQGSGKISPSGIAKVTAGKSKTYKISAASKQKIEDVTVDGLSVGAVTKYSFSNITADHSIVATFAPLTYTISASAQGSGSISPAGSVSLPYGDSKTYTITPSTNCKIVDVAVDGKSVGAVASHSFTGIKANHSITATFSSVTGTISASVQGGGTISPPGSTSVGIGNSQSYAITPSSNNRISDVKVDGVSVGAVTSYQFSNVSTNHSITAVFTPISYTISTATQGNGTISPSGPVSVNSGNSTTFRMTPASGYKISSVQVDGIPAGSISDYTFTGISGNHTIQANFVSLNPLPVAEAGPVQVVGSGSSVTLNGSNSSAAGSSIASYRWTQIGGPSVTLSNSAAPVCTFTAPTVTTGAALTFRLGVTTQSGLSAEDTCIVDVSGTDLPPSVHAGADQTVAAYTIVTLDGSQSSSDDIAASYQWVQTSGPSVTIDYADTALATFVAPATSFGGCTLGFELTVTNSSGLKMTDQCLVNVMETNVPPVADAGSDQTAYAKNTVVLDGAGSVDQGNGIVSYRWTQLSGSPVTLSDPTASVPTFTAPDSASGLLLLSFMLTVTDAGGLSASDNCVVTVLQSNTK